MPWCPGKQAMKMKLYGQKPKQLCCGNTQWEPDQNKVKVSLFQHALNDDSSVRAPRSCPKKVSTTGRELPQEGGIAMCKETDNRVGHSGSDYMWDTLSLTPFHLGLLERQRRGELSSSFHWPSYVGTYLGTASLCLRDFSSPKVLINLTERICFPILQAESH